MAIPKVLVNKDDVTVGKLTLLSREESHHAIRVRRLKEGDDVVLIDGKGLRAKATITDANKNAVALMVIDKQIVDAKQPDIVIAVAMPKADRQKIMFDMLAQLGASEIIPLACEFSSNQWTDKLADKAAKIMLEACKQSENPWVPEISLLQSFEACINSELSKGSMIVYGHTQPADISDIANNSAERILVLIGPEGGFSEAEFQLLTANEGKVKAIQIGEHILRTETAAIAMTSYMKALF